MVVLVPRLRLVMEIKEIRNHELISHIAWGLRNLSEKKLYTVTCETLNFLASF